MSTIRVPADKVRAGDVVALCGGVEPDVVIATANYYGHHNGCNCVQIAFVGDDGEPYLMHTPGWYSNGTFAPSKQFYVAEDVAPEICNRPYAMDEFYAGIAS